jgi:hypothetical protein
VKYLFCLFFFSALLNAEEGMFRAKDTRVPGVIEIAGESVLQIVLMGNHPQEIPQSAYNSYLYANPGENFVTYLAIQRVKKCKEDYKVICELPYVSYGSAFVTDDGRSLWTARHVVEAQLSGKLAFELYNSDGEKVFDTSDSKDMATLSVVGREELVQKRHANVLLDDGLLKFTSDYAKINLNHALAIRSLRISNKKPKENEKVYTVGYANIALRAPTAQSGVKTRSRVAIGTVKSSVGRVANEKPQEKQRRLASEQLTSQHLIIMDLDGIHGQSGSPVINESGEVVGIYIAGNAGMRGDFGPVGIAPHFEGIQLNGQ